MAARRERRRPTTERRYQFGPTQPDIAPEEQALEDELEQEEAEGGTALAAASARASTLSSTSTAGATRRTSTVRATPAGNPLADYNSEYAYVWIDLRRIVVVVGILLAALLVLYFLLPR